MRSTNKRYHSLLKINNAIVNQESKESLFRTLSLELGQVLQHDRFSINIYNENTNTLSYFTTADGVTPKEITKDNRSLENGAIAKAVIESRKPLIIHDLAEYSAWPSARAMLKSGLQGTIACPLIIRNQVLGSLHLSFKKTPSNINELAKFVNELSSQVAIAVDNMLAQARLKELNASLQEQKRYLLRQVERQYYPDNFFFSSPQMREVMAQVKLIADTEASVLITGETGTGKDYLARCIHNFSPRKDAMFVKISCPALASSLFESELFGHAKGAFTGAHAKRIGRFEMADEGTVFLDEIGELPVSLQAKLLQVLQDKTFERVGDSTPTRINFRIIAATNKTTEQLTSENSFRSDLFYRINTVSLTVPPLRERVQDIPILIEKLNIVESEKHNRPAPRYNSPTMELLCQYSWPGNVRELKNLVKRMIILYPDQEITRDKLKAMISSLQEYPEQAIEDPGQWPSLAQVEKRHIQKTLRQASGKISGPGGAAGLLNIPRSTLLYRMQKYGLKPEDYKHP